MSDGAIGSQLRAARTRKGLTQAAVAERSGTSRVTVARLESQAAQDIRLQTLSRLCQALDLEIQILPPGELARHEAALARAQDAARRLDRRRSHAALAARLLAAPPAEAAKLLSLARANVERWQRGRTCSRHYILRWRRLLSGPVSRVAQALLRHDDWTDALFQNSPWAFALGAPA